MRGQAAPMYWVWFLGIIFGIYMMVTFLSPTMETMSSLARNLTEDLPLNGSVNTTVNQWNLAYNIAPVILMVGLLFAIFIVAKKRNFDPMDVMK